MGIVIGVIVVILLILLIIYNGLIISRNKVKQARSSIDVYLTQRFELIPNLVECVKGYMKHEQTIMEKVAELRSDYNNTKNLKSGAELNSICNSMIGVAENNPNLKANEQFLELQKNLSKMESQLQAARRLYNSEVTVYNTKIATIPTNIFAGILGFKEEELFVADEEARANINIDI